MKDKRIEKITIKEICEAAEINRTTFYKYYDNEYVLLEDIVNEAITNLDSTIENYKSDVDVLVKILTYINENFVMFRVLFDNNADQSLPKKIFSLPRIYESITMEANKKYSEDEINYLFSIIVNGGYATIRHG